MKKTFKKPLIGITVDQEVCHSYARYPWYALRENYAHAIDTFGGIPLLLIPLKSHIHSYLDLIDGLVVTGNDADIHPQLYSCDQVHPSIKTKDQRTQFELELTQHAGERNIPFLGICNGLQILNVVRGGCLIQHLPDHNPCGLEHAQSQPKHLPTHAIHLKKETILQQMMNTDQIHVNSTHHQAVNQLGKNLIISAWAEDSVIEGLEATDQKFCLGVQWHPEYLTTKHDQTLFENFIKACQS